MTNPELMCKIKSGTDMFRCDGYRQRRCNGCKKRDVVSVCRCDECFEVLDKSNPPHDHNGKEFCGECYEKIMEGVELDG